MSARLIRLGRGPTRPTESVKVLLLYEVEGNVSRTRVRIPAGPPRGDCMIKYTQREWDRVVGIGPVPEDMKLQSTPEGPDYGFDEAKSTDMDNRQGEGPNPSKTK